MKSCVQCFECSICAKYQGFGFVSTPEYFCTNDGKPRQPLDACSSGVIGTPQKAVMTEDVFIPQIEHPNEE